MIAHAWATPMPYVIYTSRLAQIGYFRWESLVHYTIFKGVMLGLLVSIKYTNPYAT